MNQDNTNERSPSGEDAIQKLYEILLRLASEVDGFISQIQLASGDKETILNSWSMTLGEYVGNIFSVVEDFTEELRSLEIAVTKDDE